MLARCRSVAPGAECDAANLDLKTFARRLLPECSEMDSRLKTFNTGWVTNPLETAMRNLVPATEVHKRRSIQLDFTRLPPKLAAFFVPRRIRSMFPIRRILTAVRRPEFHGAPRREHVVYHRNIAPATLPGIRPISGFSAREKLKRNTVNVTLFWKDSPRR